MKTKLKCISITEGGAKDWGKHVLLPYGVTLCGQPTPEAVSRFPVLKNKNLKGLIVNYIEEKWDITCPKCIEMYDIIMQGKENRKNLN